MIFLLKQYALNNKHNFLNFDNVNYALKNASYE